jgi:hypothetical protein
VDEHAFIENARMADDGHVFFDAHWLICVLSAETFHDYSVGGRMMAQDLTGLHRLSL